MKKLLSMLLVCVLLLSCVFTFASCGKNKLDGRYSRTNTAYEFDGRKFTLYTYGTESVSGTYKIEVTDTGEEEITFTYRMFKGDSKTTETLSFSSGDGYIQIGGVKYTKEN